MFDRFPHRWTPVLPLSELKSNPVAAEIAGERIVLFRDTELQWHALLDRCPHRGAALSLGKVTPEGHLRCQYHGWRYDGAGRCLAVPLNGLNDAALSKIRADALPTRHIGGAVWVYTGLTAEPPEPVLPASLQGDPNLYVTYHQEWDANWSRAQENFIDFAHPPYLHEQTIGAWMHDYAEQGGTARVDTEATDYGMQMLSYVGRSAGGFRMDWYRPNLSILHFGATAYNLLHVFCIPVNAGHTRVMTVRRVRSESDVDSYSRHASGTDHRILDEDRAIVESQHGDVLSDPTEISVATDGPTLLFRDWYRNLLASGD
jgi:phenylpropionate dioxygenase-like ring-hydroxylating dioxygenase large terminal subunit